jgi:hypothetical protein
MSQDNKQINMIEFRKDIQKSFKQFENFLEKTEYMWDKEKNAYNEKFNDNSNISTYFPHMKNLIQNK